MINRLIKLGWNIGSVTDGGGFHEMYKELLELNLGVEVTFDSYPFNGGFGYEADSEDGLIGIEMVEFYRLGSIKRGSYIYEELEEKHRYKPEELKGRLVSELILQGKKAFI